MLQQTRATTVAQRYRDFLRQYPDVRSLARARAEQVCEAWAGLGYYSRARNLHAAARRVVAEHGGRLPQTVEELRALPGIGRYTAGAIASIAFGKPVPAVDGNVERVVSRLFAIDSGAERPLVQKRLWDHAATLARCNRPGDLNQALMDVGATTCLPREPRCAECPLRKFCLAYEAGEPTRFSRRSVRPAERSTLRLAFLWHRTRAGVWLERRPLAGLWAGLWQLPGEEGHTARARLARRFGEPVQRRVSGLRHELTHRIVIVSVYVSARATSIPRSATMRAFTDPLGAPLSAVARRAITAALEAGL